MRSCRERGHAAGRRIQNVCCWNHVNSQASIQIRPTHTGPAYRKARRTQAPRTENPRQRALREQLPNGRCRVRGERGVANPTRSQRAWSQLSFPWSPARQTRTQLQGVAPRRHAPPGSTNKRSLRVDKRATAAERAGRRRARPYLPSEPAPAHPWPAPGQLDVELAGLAQSERLLMPELFTSSSGGLGLSGLVQE